MSSGISCLTFLVCLLDWSGLAFMCLFVIEVVLNLMNPPVSFNVTICCY